MTIQVGDTIPAVTLRQLTDAGMGDLDTGAALKGKKVVIFGVPGAFTPTCTREHLPGFVTQAGALKAKGVDEIYCMSVNDPFVMKAWADSVGAGSEVSMMPDGNGELTRKLGLEMDGSAAGLGTRCQRFALVAEDGKVTALSVEPSRGLTCSRAEDVLALL